MTNITYVTDKLIKGKTKKWAVKGAGIFHRETHVVVTKQKDAEKVQPVEEVIQ